MPEIPETRTGQRRPLGKIQRILLVIGLCLAVVVLLWLTLHPEGRPPMDRTSEPVVARPSARIDSIEIAPLVESDEPLDLSALPANRAYWAVVKFEAGPQANMVNCDLTVRFFDGSRAEQAHSTQSVIGQKEGRVKFFLSGGTSTQNEIRAELVATTGYWSKEATGALTYTTANESPEIVAWAAGTGGTVLTGSLSDDEWSPVGPLTYMNKTEYVDLLVGGANGVLLAGTWTASNGEQTGFVTGTGTQGATWHGDAPMQVDEISSLAGSFHADPSYDFLSDCVYLATRYEERGWEVQKTEFLGTTRHWITLDLADGREISDVFTVGEDVVWAVGKGGFLARSGDGGRSWVRQDPGTDADLDTIVAADADNAWVAGYEQTLLRTRDGGATWSRLRWPHRFEFITDLACVDGNHLWATGDHDLFARTSNGGESWTFFSSGYGAEFNSVAAADWDTVVAVGDGLSIVSTRDGGESWRRHEAGKPLYDGMTWARRDARLLAVGLCERTPVPGSAVEVLTNPY